MNAAKVLTTLNEIAAIHAPSIANVPEFQKLAQSLREEIALAEQKKAGKTDRFKAALRFSKWVHREQKNNPSLAGAYIDEKGAQWIFHPNIAVRYEKPFDGLIQAEEGEKPASAERVMNRYDSNRPVKLIPLAELKTKLKLDKATGNVDSKGRSITTLDGVHFNTDYLIKLTELVEPEETYFSDDGKYPLLVVMGQGSNGVLCPMRID